DFYIATQILEEEIHALIGWKPNDLLKIANSTQLQLIKAVKNHPGLKDEDKEQMVKRLEGVSYSPPQSFAMGQSKVYTEYCGKDGLEKNAYFYDSYLVICPGALLDISVRTESPEEAQAAVKNFI